MTQRDKNVGSGQSAISVLELAIPGGSALIHRLSRDPAVPSAAVDAGCLVSFLADVSEQHRSDVLNSLLLAQLAANKKFDREKDVANWYTFYRSVLEQIGWVVRQQANFLPFQIDSASITADEVIISSMKTIIDEGEVTSLQATLDALKSLGDQDERVVVFETQSHTASSDNSQTSTARFQTGTISSGNFQISVIRESEGVVVMKLGAFFFSTVGMVTRLLSFSFPSQGTRFFQGSQILELNEDVYAPLRETIANKLGDAAVKLIGDLAI